MKEKMIYQAPKLNVVSVEPESVIMVISGGASFSLHGQLHGTGTSVGAW